ncbi:hypothetical protein H8356DRAFT_1435814 [Neocallimastix lanati (nom. inval.)]|jgi:hypothetical protein|nr:hypothetical protein H8356DRAFT_1435814 [Neocallimastix sp. JGI-2020a]
MKKLNVLYCYFIHCLGGKKTDFQFVKKQTEETFEKVFINKDNEKVSNVISCYCSSVNSGYIAAAKTPLEVMIDNDFMEYTQHFETNFMEELKFYHNKYLQEDKDLELNVYITIVGHSIGGNIARGIITKLYSTFSKNEIYKNYFEYIKQKNSFISNIQPCSFVSICSPHLGSLTANSKKSDSFFKKAEKFVVRNACSSVLGGIGKELVFQDNQLKNTKLPKIHENTSKNLLIDHCNPKAMDALAQFPNRTLFSFLRHDLQVKYCSAMGCLETPLPYLLKKEKSLLIPDNQNDIRIVMISGFEKGPELDFYKKELFNEALSKGFYYNNTKIVPSPDIDAQIQRALKMKFSKFNEEDYEKMEDVFVDDNDQQLSMPVAVVKLFNKISFRRITMDLVLPSSLWIATHGITLDGDVSLTQKPYMRNLIDKAKFFYSHLLISDFIRTSEQYNTYSLLNMTC